MLVVDQPLPVSFLTADGHAHPMIILLALGIGTADVVHDMSESCLRSVRYFQSFHFNSDWTTECFEPFIQVLSGSLFASILERRRQIELHDVVGVVRHTPVRILVSESLAVVFNDCANLRLVSG